MTASDADHTEAAERAAAAADLDAVLHECGIDYPTGLRGVRDLYQLFLGQKDRAEEAEAAVADLRARVEALAADFDANGNGCALGDPTAGTWHKASNLLRAALTATDQPVQL